jgi:hypothetical protein
MNPIFTDMASAFAPMPQSPMAMGCQGTEEAPQQQAAGPQANDGGRCAMSELGILLMELLMLLELMTGGGAGPGPASHLSQAFGGPGSGAEGPAGGPGFAAGAPGFAAGRFGPGNTALPRGGAGAFPHQTAREQPGASGVAGSGTAGAGGNNTPVGYIPPSSLEGTHGGQCVAFVQNQLGTHYDLPYAKMMLNPGAMPGYNRTNVPRPGEIFVMTQPPADATYGHTGFVKSVNQDGTVTVIDSNWGDNETVYVHNIPQSEIAGYLMKS